MLRFACSCHYLRQWPSSSLEIELRSSWQALQVPWEMPSRMNKTLPMNIEISAHFHWKYGSVAFECLRMLSNAFECLRMPSNAFECLWMPSNAFECLFASILFGTLLEIVKVLPLSKGGLLSMSLIELCLWCVLLSCAAQVEKWLKLRHNMAAKKETFCSLTSKVAL